MLKAYLGIVGRQGLEVFCPEHPETLKFLERRVQRAGGRVLGFWSVADDEAVAQVKAALRCGDRRAALQLLEQAARDGGPLCPSQAEAADTWVLRADR